MSRWAELQSQRNLHSRAAWETFADHRQRLQAELVAACDQAGVHGGRLCVLGAGNCNDLDLAQLATRFAELHLVDLDAAALAHAVAARPAAGARCVLHGGVDLTGLGDALAAWPALAADADADSLQLEKRIAEHALHLPGPFDAVLAAGVLSQVIECAAESLGSGHAQLPALAAALRAQHVRQVIGLMRPGGAAVLATDFVSSETAPALARAAPAQLPELARQLLQAGNFFIGCHPQTLWDTARNDPRTAEATLSPPWTWSLGSKTMLVAALRIRRNLSPA